MDRGLSLSSTPNSRAAANASPWTSLDADDVRTAPTWYTPLKTAIDLVATALLLVVATPVMLVCMLLVKLTSPGPAIYAQTRVGLGGRKFRLYKIRTMHHNCESMTGPCWSSEHDPRVTKFGRFLRKTHLDELPQLWNVLKGEMTLVGPRPERPVFVEQLEVAIPRYRQRLAIKPGVTGLAQVQLPPDCDFESVRRKLVYDLYYVEHLGLVLDLRILLGTALKVVGMTPTNIRRLCLLPAWNTVENAGTSLPDDTSEPVVQPQPA